MADITLSAASDLLRSKIVLQGGIPAVLVCKEGGSYQDFAHYIREVLFPLRGRRGFVLGMAGNVPAQRGFSSR